MTLDGISTVGGPINTGVDGRTGLNESAATLPRQWRYGVYPDAGGMKIVSLGRVDLPIGEALRLEMVAADPGGEDVVHVQLYMPRTPAIGRSGCHAPGAI
jgi:hypothetical protein